MPATLVTADRVWAAEFLGRPPLPDDCISDFAASLGALDLDGESPRFIRLAGPIGPDAELLLRTLRLRSLPAPLTFIVDEGCPDGDLARLEAEGGQVYFWPRDRERLRGFWRRTPQEAPPAPAALLARRLRCWTPSLVPLAQRLALAAEHDITVLLTGETGTGKTYLARLLHELSPRRSERFCTVPCGAIAPTLIESEFFGHVRGAFTGADRARIGKFAAAGAGTLLLDEVDALPLEQQANLLRIVESGEFEPVGSAETQQIRCRVIVASNRDLAAEVAAGRFRDDLYWRLNVMPFHLPPLRQRQEDLPWLIRGLAARFAAKFKKPLRDVAPETLALLAALHWPGNLRQLENAVQAAVLLCRGDQLLPGDFAELGQSATDAEAILPFSPRGAGAAPPAEPTLSRNRESSERTLILRTLAQHGQRRAEAARALGVSRVTLYKKMKKYGLFAAQPLALTS